MHKKFIWTNSKGQVIVSKPNYGYEGFVGMSDDEILQAYLDQKAPVMNGASYTVLPMEEKTASGKAFFRDSWVLTDGKVDVDMVHAQASHMNDIRLEREKLWHELDVAFMRALEEKDTVKEAEVVTKKQALRDIPATFDITTDVDTPEKLKAKWPSELPARE